MFTTASVDVTNALAIQWMPLACKVAIRLRRRWATLQGMDEADVQQIALMALVRCSRQFDPTRGVRFGTYLVPAVEHALANLATRQQRRRLPLAEGWPREPAAPEYDAAAELSDAIQVDELLALLPARQRAILERRYGLGGLAPETLEQVGRSLGVTRERVRQIEALALERLRHKL